MSQYGKILGHLQPKYNTSIDVVCSTLVVSTWQDNRDFTTLIHNPIEGVCSILEVSPYGKIIGHF